MTAPAIETTEITLEDIAPPCDLEPCDHQAEWLVTIKCCGSHALICEAHRKETLDNTAQGLIFLCGTCKNFSPGPPWAAIERL